MRQQELVRLSRCFYVVGGRQAMEVTGSSPVPPTPKSERGKSLCTQTTFHCCSAFRILASAFSHASSPRHLPHLRPTRAPRETARARCPRSRGHRRCAAAV